MEPELNKYEHPRMSRKQWEAIYREPWPLYYTPSSEPGSWRQAKELDDTELHFLLNNRDVAPG
jgi:hypothetical protein